MYAGRGFILGTGLRSLSAVLSPRVDLPCATAMPTDDSD